MSRPTITIAGYPYTFITLRGLVQQFGVEVENVTRKGADGAAFRQNAKRSAPIEITAVCDTDSLDNANGMYLILAHARGSLISIVDDRGQSFDQVMLLNVVEVDSKSVLAASGGVSTQMKALLTLRLTVQATEIV